MLIEITYNVTDVFMSTTETPVYVEISFEQPSGSAAVWGSITGTLSNQTDLQNALNAKFDDPTGTTLQYIDGTGALQTFPLTLPVLQEVRNQTGATLDAGTVVYINGATGNKPTVTKAIATGDATSAQTLGMISAAIANNGVGYVVVIGTCGGLDTSAYTEGQQLYLSGTVAGGVTTTKPYAPIHLVYVGIVTRAHPNLGTIEVRVQNGIEVDEIHNVSAQTPSNNDGLFYNTSTSLWESKSITTALGYTPVPTSRTITINGVTYDLSADRTFSVGTISGSGASGQVTYWTGASAVSGSNNLFWDNTNGRFGIGTNAPTNALHIVKNANSVERVQIVNSSTGSSAIAMFDGKNSADSFQMGIVSSTYVNSLNILSPNDVFLQANTSGNLVFSTINSTHIRFAVGVSAGGGERMRLFSTGNLVLQNGGTFSDGGQRLQVIGDTLLRGSGNTSATTALTVQNSSSANILRLLNDNTLKIGSQNIDIFPTADGSAVSNAGRGLIISTSAGTQTTGAVKIVGSSTLASGNDWSLWLSHSFAPASGTATHSGLLLNQTINQTGGANGITRGLYVNPTLTAAADFRAIETTAGNVLFGSNFFWDNTNGRLGIGTNAPTQRLTVSGRSLFLNDAGVTAANHTIAEFYRFSSGAGNAGFGVFYSANGTAPTLTYLYAPGALDFAIRTFNTSLGIAATNIRCFATTTNVGINTDTDLGYRFAVIGDTLLRGSGATSATTALTVQNSSSTDILNVRNDGAIFIGSVAIAQRPYLAGYTNLTEFGAAQRTLGIVTQFIAGNRPDPAILIKNSANLDYISGTGNFLSLILNYSPTSGTGVLNNYVIQPTINQTGGANGITRGLYVNPTLTAAADFRAIEWSNNSGWGLYGAGTANNYLGGNVAIGSTSNTTDWLNIAASTTAKAHIYLAAGVAPTSPANGDIWFDGTDIKMRIGGVTKTFTLV